MRCQKACRYTLLAAALLSLTALADGFRYVPKWTLVTMPSGDQRACYDFEQAKALAMLDVDLQACADVRADVPRLNEAHQKTVAGFLAQLKASEAKSLELKEQRDALLTALRVSEKARIVAENSPLSPAGWLTAAGVGLFAAGLGVALVVTSQKK